MQGDGERSVRFRIWETRRPGLAGSPSDEELERVF